MSPPATPDPAPARPARCALHPSRPAVGTCSVCERPMCVSCAVPVRGDLVGPECLSSVLEDPPEIPPPPPVAARGAWMALAGFGLAVAATVLPWARFGPVSGFFEAWTLHWSLLAALAATAGVVLAAFGPRIGGRARWAATGLLLLGVTVIVGAVLHALRPPPLSRANPLSVGLAVAGGAFALVGAARVAITSLGRPGRPARTAVEPSEPARG